MDRSSDGAEFRARLPVLNPAWRHGASGGGAGGGMGTARRGILRSRQLPPTLVQSDDEDEGTDCGGALGAGKEHFPHNKTNNGPGRRKKDHSGQPMRQLPTTGNSSLYDVMYDGPVGPCRLGAPPPGCLHGRTTAARGWCPLSTTSTPPSSAPPPAATSSALQSIRRRRPSPRRPSCGRSSPTTTN